MTKEEYEDKDDFYYDDYDGQSESCTNCGRMYDDIDYDFQSCSKCGWDEVNNAGKEQLKREAITIISEDGLVSEHETLDSYREKLKIIIDVL